MGTDSTSGHRITDSTDDMGRVVAHARQRQARDLEISDAAARVIASMYHGGQASLGYAFASTGRIDLTVDYPGSAIYADLFSGDSDYSRLTTDARLLADMLGTYLQARVRARRAEVPGWSGLWLADDEVTP